MAWKLKIALQPLVVEEALDHRGELAEPAEADELDRRAERSHQVERASRSCGR